MFRDGMSGRIDPVGFFEVCKLKNLTSDEVIILLEILKELMVIENTEAHKEKN